MFVQTCLDQNFSYKGKGPLYGYVTNPNPTPTLTATLTLTLTLTELIKKILKNDFRKSIGRFAGWKKVLTVQDGVF
jgi:hypothetical protein